VEHNEQVFWLLYLGTSLFAGGWDLASQHNFQEMKQTNSTGLVELLPKIHKKTKAVILSDPGTPCGPNMVCSPILGHSLQSWDAIERPARRHNSLTWVKRQTLRHEQCALRSLHPSPVLQTQPFSVISIF
jgi:hypothetical protein